MTSIGSNGRTVLTFLLGVAAGTGSAITAKVVYGLQSLGEDAEVRYFEKPLFLTWLMFLAMTLAMPVHWMKESYMRSSHIKQKLVTANVSEDQCRTTWRTLFLLLVPTCFDLAATALATAGLLYTTVSVYQLVRCSVTIVTALLKATVLRQSLTSYMWIGLSINTIGQDRLETKWDALRMAKVGVLFEFLSLSAMILITAVSFAPRHMEVQPGVHHGDPRLGIVLILLSCLVQGSQYVFEEKLMIEEQTPPLLVVGMEGVWGALLMMFIVLPWAEILPGSDTGECVENLYDSWMMIQNSGMLLLFLYFICVLLYNIFAIYVTFLLSSVWHAILENFRPGAIWLTDLALFYIFTPHTFGEAWTVWSWLELGGMAIMMVGTAIYNGSVRNQQEAGDEIASSTAVSECASPIIGSPLIQRSLTKEHRWSQWSGLDVGPISNLPPRTATSLLEKQSTTSLDEEQPLVAPAFAISRSYGSRSHMHPPRVDTDHVITRVASILAQQREEKQGIEKEKVKHGSMSETSVKANGRGGGKASSQHSSREVSPNQNHSNGSNR